MGAAAAKSQTVARERPRLSENWRDFIEKEKAGRGARLWKLAIRND
jgi:hypothetical protein